jgi:sugar phosphate isomerase/epimerase
VIGSAGTPGHGATDEGDLRIGLCSVTFRHLDADEVIAAASGAVLEGIEWGGDVHVPTGEVARARQVAARCRDTGLSCPSYGSYVMAGATTPAEVAAAVDTACALGAPNLRVWAAWGVEPHADEAERRRVAEDLRVIADRAGAAGLSVSLEFHPHTLTATAASTIRLLAEVDRANLYTYWQPEPGADPVAARAEFATVAADCSHLHVFWWAADGTRLSLADGAAAWAEVLADRTERRWSGERWAFLEFVPDDDPAVLGREADLLRRLVAEAAR